MLLYLSHRDPRDVFELRCACTLTCLSLLEGCNDHSRPRLIAQAIDFNAVKTILDQLWDLVKVPLLLSRCFLAFAGRTGHTAG